MRNDKLKWGIIGLGKISHSFIRDLKLVESAQIAAVASRSLPKARAFANEHNVKTYYGSYQELFQDAGIDIVYIGTPHDSHMRYSIEAMSNGKHVLCEKSLAVNVSQVQKMVEASRQNNVFLMEALWSRFNPVIREIISKVKNGEIGEANYVQADFTFSRNDSDDSRLLNMDLAGGSLLDMGIYPVFLAYVILGKPDEILATGRFHDTGADIQTSAILKYKNGMANVMSGFRSQGDMSAKICGTKGTILIDPRWHETEGYRMFEANSDKAMERFHISKRGKGYTYEIEECGRCIEAGRIESSLWSHQNSLELMEILDTIRDQIGLKYPFE